MSHGIFVAPFPRLHVGALGSGIPSKVGPISEGIRYTVSSPLFPALALKWNSGGALEAPASLGFNTSY